MCVDLLAQNVFTIAKCQCEYIRRNQNTIHWCQLVTCGATTSNTLKYNNPHMSVCIHTNSHSFVNVLKIPTFHSERTNIQHEKSQMCITLRINKKIKAKQLENYKQINFHIYTDGTFFQFHIHKLNKAFKYDD